MEEGSSSFGELSSPRKVEGSSNSATLITLAIDRHFKEALQINRYIVGGYQTADFCMAQAQLPTALKQPPIQTPTASKQASDQASKQANNQASKQANNQASKQASDQASKQTTKQTSKQATKQASKQPSKQATKQASKQTTKLAS